MAIEIQKGDKTDSSQIKAPAANRPNVRPEANSCANKLSGRVETKQVYDPGRPYDQLSGLSVASLIVGLYSLLGPGGIIGALTACLLGVAAIKSGKRGSDMAWAGIVLSIATAVIILIQIIILGASLNSLNNSLNNMFGSNNAMTNNTMSGSGWSINSILGEDRGGSLGNALAEELEALGNE